MGVEVMEDVGGRHLVGPDQRLPWAAQQDRTSCRGGSTTLPMIRAKVGRRRYWAAGAAIRPCAVAEILTPTPGCLLTVLSCSVGIRERQQGLLSIGVNPQAVTGRLAVRGRKLLALPQLRIQLRAVTRLAPRRPGSWHGSQSRDTSSNHDVGIGRRRFHLLTSRNDSGGTDATKWAVRSTGEKRWPGSVTRA